MRKMIMLLSLMVLLLTFALASAQSPEPTQTPYIVYVVITAEPEEQVIERPQVTPEPPASTDMESIIYSVVSTLTAMGVSPQQNTDTNTDTITSVPIYVYPQENTQDANVDGTWVRQSDGSTCLMSFRLVNEPTYAGLANLYENEVYWKEWTIENTGSCVWTPEYHFKFANGWQIGSTQFTMNKTTYPGEYLTVRIGLTAALCPGTYYTSYTMEAPDGSQYGGLLSNFRVNAAPRPSGGRPKPPEPPAHRPKPPAPPTNGNAQPPKDGNQVKSQPTNNQSQPAPYITPTPTADFPPTPPIMPSNTAQPAPYATTTPTTEPLPSETVTTTAVASETVTVTAEASETVSPTTEASETAPAPVHQVPNEAESPSETPEPPVTQNSQSAEQSEQSAPQAEQPTAQVEQPATPQAGQPSPQVEQPSPQKEQPAAQQSVQPVQQNPQPAAPQTQPSAQQPKQSAAPIQQQPTLSPWLTITPTPITDSK